MVKAVSIEFLQIHPPSIPEMIRAIIYAGEFKPATTPIGKGEAFIRNLTPLEKALFTLLIDTTAKYNAITASLVPVSPVEELLLTEYESKSKLFHEIFMETISSHPLTEDVDTNRIGIREGHIIVLLPEKKHDFLAIMLKPNCISCANYLSCDYPEREIVWR